VAISAVRPRSLPTISKPEDLVSFFAKWKSALTKNVRVARPAPPPFNFTVVPGASSHVITWAKVQPDASKQKADGYEILKSLSGDFVSDVQTIPIRDINQTSYTDPVGASVQAHYRIHTTSGTDSQPHSVKGTSSGVVKATTGSGVTGKDIVTNDQTRALTRFGRYKETL